MTPKMKALLGFARKAGKIYSGESQVEALFKKGKGDLIIIANDSRGALNKFEKWSLELRIPLIIGASKEELGFALGMSPRSVVLIADKGFAEAIIKESDHTS